ncbi:hypothetical protein [Celerinatantimonas yamalensis]|uniref:Uncharacterized protein n=1 Tax=Celerinatantimonas yamalensis TaxID=559956 RepID=A0ABW9G396_9GAMM
MALLFSLLLAYLVIYFYLWPQQWQPGISQPYRSLRKLLLCGLALACVNALLVGLWGGSLLESVGFGVISALCWWLLNYCFSYNGNRLYGFLAVQLCYLCVLLAICQWVTGFIQSWHVAYWSNYHQLVVLIGYLVIFKPTSVAIAMLLVPWNGEFNDDDAHRAASLPSLPLAGQLIGYLERAITLTFILNYQFAAIGWVLGAKSIFHFGELKNTQNNKLTEYIMVGTLASFAMTSFGWHDRLSGSRVVI